MSSNNDDDRDNSGYGKPPKHRQFKKGQSGNRKGRPRKDKKGGKVLQEYIEDALSKVVTVQMDGKNVKVTKREIIATQLVNSAAKGEKKPLDYVKNMDKERLAEKEKANVFQGGAIIIPEGIPGAWEIELECHAEGYHLQWDPALLEAYKKTMREAKQKFFDENREHGLIKKRLNNIG